MPRPGDSSPQSPCGEDSNEVFASRSLASGSRFPAAQQTQHRITRSTSPRNPCNPFTATRNLEHGPLGDSASKFDKPSLRCDHDVAIDWSIEKNKTDIVCISDVHSAQLRHQRPAPPQTATRSPGCRSPPRYARYVNHSSMQQQQHAMRIDVDPRHARHYYS